MNPIVICGCGPGSFDYITPMVQKTAQNADCLIGAKRLLNHFASASQEQIPLTADYTSIGNTLKNRGNKKYVVLVTGDTGFYSLFSSLKSILPNEDIIAEPGISSFQYMFAKLGKGYEDAVLCSAHGRTIDIGKELDKGKPLFILTDKKWTPQYIAQLLIEKDKSGYKIHIGEKLSYPDEEILSLSVQEAVKLSKKFSLCSVIIDPA